MSRGKSSAGSTTRPGDSGFAAGAALPASRRRLYISFLCGAAMIAIIAAYFFALQFSTDAIIENDGYFHIKYSYLMSHGAGIIRKLPWLYYTIHRDYYRDHHFLFHVLYIPFTFGDLRLGAKLASWTYASLGVFAFYLVCARRGKLMAAILTFLLLGASTLFLTRMLFARVPSLSMAALLLGADAIITRSYRRLAIIMFGFVWLYDGFILLLIMSAFFFLAGLLVERRADWRLAFWTCLGLVAGIVINPYFPRNVSSYWFNLTRAAGEAQLIERTGWEWVPYDSWTLLTMAKVIWIGLGLGLALAILRGRPTRETFGLFLFAIFVTLLMMKARRYMETWPACVLLFLGYAWADFWDEKAEEFGKRARLWRWAATAALAGLIAFTPGVFAEQRRKTANEKPFEYYKGAAEWLKQNTPPKSIVFNSDWDDFPFLFFFNSENYYILGLDQLYMARYDMELFKLWRDISNGLVENPGRLIYERFGAVAAVADRMERRAFVLRASRDPNMRKVYEDRYCVVFRVMPP